MDLVRVFDLLLAEHTIRHRRTAEDPAAVLAALADTAERGERPAPRCSTRSNAPTVPDPVEWTVTVRRGFLRVAPRRAMPVSTRWRPSIASGCWPVSCRRGRTCAAGPSATRYHRLTVDAHLTTAMSGMAAWLDRAETDDPTPSRDGQGSDDIDGLLLGAVARHRQDGRGSHVPIGTASRRRRSPDGGASVTVISPRSWWRSICCCPTRRPAAISPTRTSSWMWPRGSVRPSGSPRSRCWRRQMRRRPGRQRGRRGVRPSSVSWSRGSSELRPGRHRRGARATLTPVLAR